MITFLESLEIPETDFLAFEKRNKAIEAEKVFKNVFANPNDNILRMELEKIQLKFLIGSNENDVKKVYKYYENLLAFVRKNINQSSKEEKAYFEQMEKILFSYKTRLDDNMFKGNFLEDKENLVKIIFKEINSPKADGTSQIKKYLMLNLVKKE